MLIEPLSGRRQLKRSRSDSEWSTPSLTTGQSGTHRQKCLNSQKYMYVDRALSHSDGDVDCGNKDISGYIE